MNRILRSETLQNMEERVHGQIEAVFHVLVNSVVAIKRISEHIATVERHPLEIRTAKLHLRTLNEGHSVIGLAVDWDVALQVSDGDLNVPTSGAVAREKSNVHLL
jgi:hypothetical protein